MILTQLFLQGFCLKFPKFWVRQQKSAELASKFAWARPKNWSELGAQNRKKTTVHIVPIILYYQISHNSVTNLYIFAYKVFCHFFPILFTVTSRRSCPGTSCEFINKQDTLVLALRTMGQFRIFFIVTNLTFCTF